MKKNKKATQTEEPVEIPENNPTEEDTPEVEILDPPGQNNKYDEMLDKYQRLVAEFDNYRKRTTKEMAARYNDGTGHACEALLPMVDNLARALDACPNKEDSFYQGVAMISRQLEGILSELGVQPIPLAPGDTFDPNFHNAVAHGEDENFGTNQVADILQVGYMHREKVLRHSMVRVVN